VQFLAPLFLAGLAALAVPVLIHLTHRERETPVRFPSLMFLRRIPYRARRRQRIRHWLLFLLRLAAVALVAAAFARPLLQGVATAAPAQTEAREVVVLVDRSMSMGYGDRWQRAVAGARTVLEALSPEDRATVVLFADRAEVYGPSDVPTTLLPTLQRAEPVPGPTRFGVAFRLAGDLLEASGRDRREVVLISDLQRSGAEDIESSRLPSGATLAVVNVAAEADPSNLAVTDVLMEQGSRENRTRLVTLARIANTGAQDVRGLRVTLEMNGVALRTLTVDVPARTNVQASFPPVAAPTTPVRGRVVIDHDRLPTDDAFHFVARPVEPVRVLLLEAGGSASASLYLERALGIGGHPPFSVDIRRELPSPAALGGYDLAIANDVPVAGSSNVRSYVENGGGLLVILAREGGRGVARSIPELLGTVGTTTERLDDGGAALSILAFDHPVFEPFRAPRSGDFSSARFFSYRRVEAGTGATTLARYDDGAPALLEAAVGSGRAIVLTTDLGTAWNDLPLQPVFLPLVQRLARYLAGWTEEPVSYAAGSGLDRAWLAGRMLTSSEVAVDAPSGKTTLVVDQDAALRLDEAGFYTVRPGASATSGLLLAVNPPAAESDLTAIDQEELVAAVSALPGGGEATAGGPRAPREPSELERRQALWWYLLLMVGLVLAVETVLANRRPGEATIVAPGGS